MDENKRQTAWMGIGGATAFLIVMYAAAYSVTVRQSSIHAYVYPVYSSIPSFNGLLEVVFRPAHLVDQRLRRIYWGRYTEAETEQMIAEAVEQSMREYLARPENEQADLTARSRDQVWLALVGTGMDEHIACDVIEGSGFVRFTLCSDDAKLDVWTDRIDELIAEIRKTSASRWGRKKDVAAATLWQTIQVFAEK